MEFTLTGRSRPKISFLQTPMRGLTRNIKGAVECLHYRTRRKSIPCNLAPPSAARGQHRCRAIRQQRDQVPVAGDRQGHRRGRQLAGGEQGAAGAGKPALQRRSTLRERTSISAALPSAETRSTRDPSAVEAAAAVVATPGTRSMSRRRSASHKRKVPSSPRVAKCAPSSRKTAPASGPAWPARRRRGCPAVRTLGTPAPSHELASLD